MDFESGYIEDLKRYIYNAQQELDYLRNSLEEIENERKLEYKTEEEKSNHLKYPLNQFRLIRRFDHDWPDVNKVIDRIKSLKVSNNPVRAPCTVKHADVRFVDAYIMQHMWSEFPGNYQLLL